MKLVERAKLQMEIENGTKKEKISYKRQPKSSLNYRALLTYVNNYLIGYRKAYERVKNDDLSETKLKYEEALKQKEILEKLVKN